MKRLLLILVFMLNSILLTENAESKEDWDYPVIVYIYGIKFNYQSGYSNDALDIRKNASADISVPEWWSINGRNEEFAYIKSQSNRKIKASFCHNQRRHIYDLEIWADEYQNGFGDINETEISFPSGRCGSYSYFEFTVSGSVPGSIGKRSFYWKWYAEVANPPGPVVWVADTHHDYYTVLAAPQSPMSESWTEVLDYSCDWANGKTTSSSALVALTTKLYTNSGLYYNGGQSHYDPDRWPNPTKFVFDLTDFLYDWYDADCQDCSMFLSILSSSIGASLTQTRRIQGFFNTKSLLPIGWPSSSWTTVGWSFHHVGWLNNVYDPAIKLKPSSPYIPINKNINNPYKTDLYNSGTWSPKNAFRLGQTDPYWNVPTEIQ